MRCISAPSEDKYDKIKLYLEKKIFFNKFDNILNFQTLFSFNSINIKN